MFLFPQRLEILQPSVDFLFRIVAHGAGVDEDGIRLFDAIGQFIAVHLHNGGNHFAVGHIHLTTVGLDE